VKCAEKGDNSARPVFGEVIMMLFGVLWVIYIEFVHRVIGERFRLCVDECADVVDFLFERIVHFQLLFYFFA